MKKLNIVMFGAGNVATHLSKALKNAGHKIIQVYSRTNASMQKLAHELNAEAINDIQLIDNQADLYIFAVSDNSISQLTHSLHIKNKNVVHTAGSIPLSVFGEATNYGVFYPLQTFSKGRELNFSEIPVCIEANNREFEKLLTQLATQISSKVLKINTEQRQVLHLSAVFANNFVNHLFAITSDILVEKKIPYEILHPLIKETANKAIQMDPKLAQTGPAVRNDTTSLKKHLELLSSHPELQELYKIISNNIYLKHSKL